MFEILGEGWFILYLHVLVGIVVTKPDGSIGMSDFCYWAVYDLFDFYVWVAESLPLNGAFLFITRLCSAKRRPSAVLGF